MSEFPEFFSLYLLVTSLFRLVPLKFCCLRLGVGGFVGLAERSLLGGGLGWGGGQDSLLGKGLYFCFPPG